MKKVIIDDKLCPKNHRCPLIKVCPTKAITQKDEFSAPEIIEDKCKNCGLCTKYCFYNAFIFSEKKPQTTIQ